MQFAGLLILCMSSVTAIAAAGSASAADGEASYYRTFVRNIQELTRRPPRSPAEVRKAARLLESLDSRTLSRAFIAHNALRIADGRALPDLPAPPQPPALSTLAPHLTDTIEETARLATMLRKLGADLLAYARIRMAIREGRAAPAQADPYETARVPISGNPSARAVDIFVRIVRTAKRMSRNGNLRAAETADRPRGLERCLRIQRLNLRQCLAAARFADEEIFCTARHGFTELGMCWEKYVNAPDPPE